jgi:GNAT superfamily N-acetyltransferase
MPDEWLTVDDLESCCFAPGHEVIGDSRGAAAFVVKEYPEYDVKTAWLSLLAVPPDRQRRGVGRALVADVIERCRAARVTDLHTGNLAPRYVWPGVDLSNTPALAFFQTLGFEPYDHGLNMLLPTSFRAPAPPGVTIERETGTGAADFAREHFPHWEDEVARGVEMGGTFAARADDRSTIAFACHSVNRHTWIGPMATDSNRRSGGTGRALLGALAEDIAARHGVDEAEIAWVAPIPFYAKAGAVAHRAFRMHKLGL